MNFFKDKLPHYFQELNGDLGPIVGYQRDRSAPNSTIFPWGIIANQNLRLFNAGIANTFYYGEDLMLYYGVVYNGVQYGSDLYFGERFYHTHIRGTSFYDRLEAFYEPRIAPWLDLRVSLVFHMGNPTTAFPAFRGWQQVFSLKFNLEKLLNKYVK